MNHHATSVARMRSVRRGGRALPLLAALLALGGEPPATNERLQQQIDHREGEKFGNEVLEDAGIAVPDGTRRDIGREASQYINRSGFETRFHAATNDLNCVTILAYGERLGRRMAARPDPRTTSP